MLSTEFGAYAPTLRLRGPLSLFPGSMKLPHSSHVAFAFGGGDRHAETSGACTHAWSAMKERRCHLWLFMVGSRGGTGEELSLVSLVSHSPCSPEPRVPSPARIRDLRSNRRHQPSHANHQRDRPTLIDIAPANEPGTCASTALGFGRRGQDLGSPEPCRHVRNQSTSRSSLVNRNLRQAVVSGGISRSRTPAGSEGRPLAIHGSLRAPSAGVAQPLRLRRSVSHSRPCDKFGHSVRATLAIDSTLRRHDNSQCRPRQPGAVERSARQERGRLS